MSARGVRVSIVGLDSIYWPLAFADALGQSGGIGSLSAVCDLGCSEDAVRSQIGTTAADLADGRGAVLVHSVEEAAAAADACIVCTRHSRMPDIIIRLLRLGKPVFAAKPVALNGTAMAGILAARAISGLPCAAGMTARSSSVIRTAMRLIAEGMLGDVFSVRVSHQHGRFADWPGAWWYTDPAEGDPFHWLGWYALDGVLALTGSTIVSMAGAASTHLSPYAMPDLIRGTARLADGRIATLEIHFTVGDWGLDPFEIEVVGSRGVVRSGGHAPGLTLMTAGGPRPVPCDPAEHPLADEVSAWLRAVDGSGAPVLDFENAALIVAASDAWKRAAAERLWVTVEPTGKGG